MEAPKLFISYCWTDDTHQAFVLDLAEQLVENYVDVIIDKWHLREGQDVHAFMEQMVNNPDIKKVLLVCNKRYVEKANNRDGGVGDEAQIITPEIYGKHDQSKFVALLTELNEDGTPCKPIYFGSRVHINYVERSAAEFEQLIRWIFDKPVYIKPKLGKPPIYITENTEEASMGTGSTYRIVMDAIKNGKTYCKGAIQDYLFTFAEGIGQLRIRKEIGESRELDDILMDNIRVYTPYRNEYVQFLITLSRYCSEKEYFDPIRAFIESLYSLCFPDYTLVQTTNQQYEFDFHKFMLHELFLYTVASLISCDRYENVDSLLTDLYYSPEGAFFGRSSMVPFVQLKMPIILFDMRKSRLNSRTSNLQAEVLHSRAGVEKLTFQQIMQTDFILYLRSQLHGLEFWYPITLVYGPVWRVTSPYEIFARAKSKRYFQNILTLLGVDSKAQIESLLRSFAANPRMVVTFDGARLSVDKLIGFSELATQK